MLAFFVRQHANPGIFMTSGFSGHNGDERANFRQWSQMEQRLKSRIGRLKSLAIGEPCRNGNIEKARWVWKSAFPSEI